MRKSLFVILSSFLYTLHLFAQEPSLLPSFQTFHRYDNGQKFTADSLATAGRNILVFYDPGCGHCQELGSSIADNWEQWDEKVFFYFVSMTEKSLVKDYVKKYAPKLSGEARAVFLYDETGEFITLFDPQKFPSTYIFDAKTRRLLAHYEGKADVRPMKKHLVRKD